MQRGAGRAPIIPRAALPSWQGPEAPARLRLRGSRRRRSPAGRPSWARREPAQGRTARPRARRERDCATRSRSDRFAPPRGRSLTGAEGSVGRREPGRRRGPRPSVPSQPPVCGEAPAAAACVPCPTGRSASVSRSAPAAGGTWSRFQAVRAVSGGRAAPTLTAAVLSTFQVTPGTLALGGRRGRTVSDRRSAGAARRSSRSRR